MDRIELFAFYPVYPNILLFFTRRYLSINVGHVLLAVSRA